ncbi:MAG: hypothetical protein AAGH46_09480 [Bacteroidota bacterium]
MKIISLLLLIIISSVVKLNAQDFNQQRRGFAITNIGINGFVGGFGALINKRKGEKGFQVFMKGFGQGCLGGTFQTLGKELAYQINSKENLTYAWPARITSSIGNSIAQNAANNINFWEKWHFNLGFVRFDYTLKEKKFQARISPTGTIGFGIAASQGKLNLKQTLQTGIFIVESEDFVWALGRNSRGAAYFSSIALNKQVTGREYYELITHELVHVLQYENTVWINPLLSRFDHNLKEHNKTYRKLSDYVYFDFNGLTMYVFYLTQLKRPWECRFIEREADLYGKRIVHPTCN